MQARSLLSCSVRLSVCPSVTFVDHVKTNDHIFEIFSPLGSDTILVFPYRSECRYSDGNPPYGLRSAICRHHPPQRAVLSQICCFGERKVVLSQIQLDGAEPRDAGTT